MFSFWGRDRPSGQLFSVVILAFVLLTLVILFYMPLFFGLSSKISRKYLIGLYILSGLLFAANQAGKLKQVRAYTAQWFQPPLAWLNQVFFRQKPLQKSWLIPFASLPLLILSFWLFMKKAFGVVDIGAIIFHLQGGVAGGDFASFVPYAVQYLSLFFIVLYLLRLLLKQNRSFRYLDIFLTVLFLFQCRPLFANIYGVYFDTEYRGKLAQFYQHPEISQRPKTRKNLLFIFLESNERTFRDKKIFGTTFDPVLNIERRGLVVEGVTEVANTGWSIAGLVAAQCGLPLTSIGVMNRNTFKEAKRFLPRAKCLGDILRQDGYALSFIVGSRLSFAGQGLFLRSHGYQVIKGAAELRTPENKKSWYAWGIRDNIVVEALEKEIEQEVAQKQPFAVSTHILAGHSPNGFGNKVCDENLKNTHKNKFLYHMECGAFLADRLIARLTKKGLLKNTLVVVASDHLSMNNPYSKKLSGLKRENLLIFIDPEKGREILRKKSSMLDVYPTILELLGYRINKHQAGLGVSLLGKRPSLVEKEGLEIVNKMIVQDREINLCLWANRKYIEKTVGLLSLCQAKKIIQPTAYLLKK